MPRRRRRRPPSGAPFQCSACGDHVDRLGSLGSGLCRACYAKHRAERNKLTLQKTENQQLQTMRQRLVDAFGKGDMETVGVCNRELRLLLKALRQS